MQRDVWIATNRRVIEEFRANGGKVQGRGDLVLLTIKGAKSGEPRVYPLMSVPYQGGYLAVTSKGAAPENPSWYHNLVAHPEITVEVGTETFPATARLLASQEPCERLCGSSEGVSSVWGVCNTNGS